MRNVTIDPKNKKIDVDTIMIKDVPGLDTNQKPFDEYMKGFFFGMIGEIVWAMGNDIDRLAEMTDAFSIPGEKVKKLAWLIKPIGNCSTSLHTKRFGDFAKRKADLKRLTLQILQTIRLSISFLNLFKIFIAATRLTVQKQKNTKSHAAF